MNLAGFDTSCSTDQDCAVVQVGDVCGCDCGNAAINAKEVAAYDAELADKSSHCSSKVFCDSVSQATASGGGLLQAPPSRGATCAASTGEGSAGSLQEAGR